jgi:hypothetical protein
MHLARSSNQYTFVTIPSHIQTNYTRFGTGLMYRCQLVKSDNQYIISSWLGADPGLALKQQYM